MSKRQPNLNHRLFNVFLAAAETENFTQAAEQLAMTQPGISQQISKLEQQIGCPLFKRFGKNVKLTNAGEKLVNYINSHYENLDLFYKDIYHEQSKIDGTVRYAMPPSCSLSPHFELLLKDVTQHEHLSLDIRITLNNKIIDKVLNGKIDFGFVTEKFSNASLKYTEFCPEEYILVGSAKNDFELTENYLNAEKFIEYPGAKIYFDYWLKHFFKESKFLDYRTLHFTSTINSLEAAITMVKNNLGLSVFPRHCVEHLLETQQLYEYSEIKNKQLKPLLNTIYIVEHADFEQPYRVKNVLDWFKRMLS